MSAGKYYEQLPVGTVVQHATRRTVTETDNVLFTTMTMNPAPLHLDAQYAATTEFDMYQTARRIEIHQAVAFDRRNVERAA